MDDSSDVFFVNPHTKGDGCHNAGKRAFHEAVLDILPIPALHARMIRMGIDIIST